LSDSNIAGIVVAVKRSSSAARVLKVFERTAVLQPIGVSALARELGADKSAVQRDLMTLADAGWIRGAAGMPGQWELTPHVLTFARPPQSTDSLRQRARPALERLRSETGETAYLTVPDGDQFVVLDAIESHQMLRMVPPIGMVVPVAGSATARAILPHLAEPEQARLLDAPVTPALREEFHATRARGYAINDGDIEPSAVAMASAIVSRQGVPHGALVLTGPAERLAPARRNEVGALLRREAEVLSQGLG
jgi:IclR family acetate operon transcriptional repressor